MLKRNLIAASALSLAAAGMAHAATTATATTELNLRSGPGPQFEVQGVIAGDGEVTVERCLEAANWCEVTYDGQTGWAYGEYLTAALNDEPVIIAQNVAPLKITTVVKEDVVDEKELSAAAGSGTGALAGAIVGGPAGAAVGALAGAVLGGESVPDTAVTYVRENAVEPVYLEGEVVVGAELPDSIEFYDVPETEYRYVYANGLPVIVEAESNTIAYIVR